MSKLTTYTKGLTTKQASTSNGAIVFQFEYNDNVTDNDEWELVPAIKLDVRFDDGYRKLKGFTDVISYELSSQMSVITRVLNQVAGVELSMQTLPILYTSYADMCRNKDTDGFCSCESIDKCDSLILYDEEGNKLPGRGPHTNSESILDQFVEDTLITSDSVFCQLFTGHDNCSLDGHDDEDDDGITDGDDVLGYSYHVANRHSCLYVHDQTSSDESVNSLHELAHHFSTEDHPIANSNYNFCAMSYWGSNNQKFERMGADSLNIDRIFCSECLVALHMARHFVT